MNFPSEPIANLRAARKLLLFTERDIAEISIQLGRPNPAEAGFFSKVANPTREEIAIATLAQSLRRRVAGGLFSQAEADKQLADYRTKLLRRPFARDFYVMMTADPATQVEEGGEAVSWQDTKVSMVANANSTAPRNVTIGSILADIRSGKWARKVETIREVYAEACAMEGREEAKEAIKELKKKLPGFLASGTFSKRANANLVEHSGLLCCDLDECHDIIEAVRTKLAADPFVAAFFTSPTGSGLKAVLRIQPDASLHLCSFFAAREHFRQAYSLEIDKACKEVARLCFVSHDSQLFMRDGDAQILEPLAEQESEPEHEQSAQGCPDVELTTELRLRIERYLDRVPPAIEGEHGSDLTYRVACVLAWGFALSFNDSRIFMRAYSERCQPPWSEKEIDHKLKDARDPEKHRDKKPRGHLLGPAAAGEYDDFFNGKKKLPELDSADQFCIEPDDTPPEIIKGILHQGSKGELGGGSKTFKTWTLLQMSVCVSHGIPWLGRNTHCSKVLFINFELPRWSVRQRVRHICDALEVDYPGNLKLLNLRGYATDARVILPRIAKEIHKHGFTLVIIDPLYKILGDREENAAKDMADLMLAIERLAVVLNAAVFFGAHFSKGNQSLKEAMDRSGGSGVLARDPDTIITMTQHEEDEAYTVNMILRNFPPQEPFAIRREHPLMVGAERARPHETEEAEESESVGLQFNRLA